MNLARYHGAMVGSLGDSPRFRGPGDRGILVLAYCPASPGELPCAGSPPAGAESSSAGRSFLPGVRYSP